MTIEVLGKVADFAIISWRFLFLQLIRSSVLLDSASILQFWGYRSRPTSYCVKDVHAQKSELSSILWFMRVFCGFFVNN